MSREDRTIYICGVCNKEFTREDIDKHSHYSPCGHVVKSNMAVYVYSPSTIRNTNCPVCGAKGTDLGRPEVRTCPSIDCQIITFKIICKSKGTHP